jgi:hypothetical protein
LFIKKYARKYKKVKIKWTRKKFLLFLKKYYKKKKFSLK